jgi:hypothetical protein
MIAGIRLLAIVATTFIAACAHQSSVSENSPSIPPRTSEQPLAELPTQQLQRGQCALVLWSRDTTPVRLAVTLDQPAVARISPRGRVIELARVGQSGQPLHGQFPEQQYRGHDASLEISFVPSNAKQLTGGAIVSSAVVRYVDPVGWTSVMPAVGLIACQS